MHEKLYFFVFILCIILPQGIFGKSLEDDNGEISNVLVREKRVISRIPSEDIPATIGTVSFLVNIKKHRHLHCVGSILSHRTVITAARCVFLDLWHYDVLSGSTVANRGTMHNITHKQIHDPTGRSHTMTGIALINVNPPFVYKTTVSPISLHREPVLTGVVGHIIGWGSFAYGGHSESTCPHRVRSTSVPVMNHQVCRNIYHGSYQITEADFCTYDAQRQCGYTDAGAPFVIDNKLVGVHVGVIDTAGRELSTKPDVFVLLQHPEYSRWINRNILL